MARRPAPAPAPPPRAGAPLALIGAVTAVLLALVAVVVYLAVRGGGAGADSGAGGSVGPQTLQAQGGSGTLPAGGGVVVGADGGEDAIEVTIYEDFQCPFCGQLERSVGEQLAESAEAGNLTVTYALMSFLDEALGNDSSTRAANAAVCAADAGVFSEWHQAAFEAQPEEGAGYTDEALLGFAEQGGLSGAALQDFSACLDEGRYLDYVADMQEASERAGVTGTPTVVVEGQTLEQEQVQRLIEDPASLTAVLEEAS